MGDTLYTIISGCLDCYENAVLSDNCVVNSHISHRLLASQEILVFLLFLANIPLGIAYTVRQFFSEPSNMDIFAAIYSKLAENCILAPKYLAYLAYSYSQNEFYPQTIFFWIAIEIF